MGACVCLSESGTRRYAICVYVLISVVLLMRGVHLSRYLRESQMVKPLRMGTAVLLTRRVPSSRYLRESQMVKPSRMGTAVSLRRCVLSSRCVQEMCCVGRQHL